MPPAFTTHALKLKDVATRSLTKQEAKWADEGRELEVRTTWRKIAVHERLKAKLAARDATRGA